jgi:hypothetical protein
MNKAHLRPVQHTIEENEIVEAFERNGFKLENRREEDIALDYEERRRLWHVPAVMDSVIDTTNAHTNDIYRLVDRIVDAHRNEMTMPRTVVFWRFAPADSNALQRAAGAGEAG